MLGDDLHGKVILEYLNVGMTAHCLHESALYLGSCIIGMVQDTELGVASLAVQIKLPVLFLIEVDTPLDEVADASRCIAHHLLHCCGVADKVTGYHGVLYVLLKVVHQQVGHRGDTSLCLCGIGFLQCGLAHQRNLSLACICYFQGVTHARHATSYNKEIKFAYHVAFGFITVYQRKNTEIPAQREPLSIFSLTL